MLVSLDLLLLIKKYGRHFPAQIKLWSTIQIHAVCLKNCCHKVAMFMFVLLYILIDRTIEYLFVRGCVWGWGGVCGGVCVGGGDVCVCVNATTEHLTKQHPLEKACKMS